MTEEENLTKFLNSHQDEMINWISSNIKTQFAPEYIERFHDIINEA